MKPNDRVTFDMLVVGDIFRYPEEQYQGRVLVKTKHDIAEVISGKIWWDLQRNHDYVHPSRLVVFMGNENE